MPRILKTTSNYLSRLWNRQLLVFFFFLALSACFWVFIAGKEIKEHEFDVEVVLTGVPNNVVITTEPPKKITLTLQDELFTLVNYKYNKHDLFRVVINWADVQNSSGHVRLQTNTLLKPLKALLNSTTQVIGTRPEVVEFYYNYGLSKKVDVVIQGVVEADSAYNLIACDVSPRKVTVYGSKASLDTVTGAYLRPVSLHNLRDTASVDVYFQEVKGLKFVPKKVTLTTYADRVMEQKVQVPVRGVNFPAGKTLRTFPAKVDVTYQVGTTFSKKIGADNFVIVVNYADLIDKTDNRVALQLKSIPTGVQRARITPDEVEFIIEDDGSE